jgi:DNA-binding transcriptional ArsR family regulator
VTVESAFGIIAEPKRRAILSMLALSEQSVGEIERSLQMPQPSISKYVRVLHEAGFVEARIDAQRRVYQSQPDPLMERDAWLAPLRCFWSSHLEARGPFTMNVLLWILQVALALFSFVGGQ